MSVSERDREMAGKIVAKWRTWWGDLIDRYPSDVPLPDVPGVISRLEFADDIAAALAQARAEEREACAKVADREAISGTRIGTALSIAAAIRAREGEEK